MGQAQVVRESVMMTASRPLSRRWCRPRAPHGLVGAVLSLVLTWSITAQAAPNAWPFDFDPQLADDPVALQDGLTELGEGLPGLRDDEMTEVPLGSVSLYLFTELADALARAVGAGPALMPAIVRQPVLCVAHDGFAFPSLLIQPAAPACVTAEQTIATAFDGNTKTCMEVEFPETYVFDHPPGQVDLATVGSFEGLIAVAGEALSHLDYPAGLLPDDFFSKLRPIIAKLRYARLTQQLDDRMAGYAAALQQLNSSSACFDSGAKASFEGTVAGLTAELNQAKQQLDQLYQDGMSQAGADRAAMAAQCRARNDLPHPALSDEERILLSVYIGGIFWRARGAGLLAYPPDPEQGLLRRLLYVKYPYQLIGDLTGGGDAEGVGDSILIDENWGWDEWWDMGTTPGSADKYSDLVGMTKRGKRGVTLVRPQVEGRGYDIRSLVAGGLQMGPCYYYAWDQLADFTLGDDLQDPYMWFIEWPTSIGEFCAGAALAEGLARTMLWGTLIPPEECEVDCSDGGCGGGGSGTGGNEPCGPCPVGQECNDAGVCTPILGPGGSGLEPGSDGGCSCATPGGSTGLWGNALLVVGLVFLFIAGMPGPPRDGRRRRSRSGR